MLPSRYLRTSASSLPIPPQPSGAFCGRTCSMLKASLAKSWAAGQVLSRAEDEPYPRLFRESVVRIAFSAKAVLNLASSG